MPRDDHAHTETSPSAGWRTVYSAMECSTDIEDTNTAPVQPDTEHQQRVVVDQQISLEAIAAVVGMCLVVMLL